MSTRNIIMLMLLVCISAWIARSKHERQARSELVIGGNRVSITPCATALKEMLGKGIDAEKSCTCVLPLYYELIKHDSAELSAFKQDGLHSLTGAANDSLTQIFRNCILENITDTSYKLNFSAEMKNNMRQTWKQTLLRSITIPKYVEVDSLCDCVVDHLDNNITIRDYFADDSVKVNRFQTLISNCIERFKKKEDK